MASPPELNTDAVSEILLRLPPDDPAGLVRASAVCKPWLSTLTDPAFLRRYRAFHGTSRVLGFLHNSTNSGIDRFVPTTAFRPHAAATAHRTCTVLDCRHGRVLLYDYRRKELVVWGPVTGSERRIALPDEDPYTNHAVLCAVAAGCDHSSCSEGPFLLAGVGTETSTCCESMACFYSSETGEWSVETSLFLFYYYELMDWPAALVGGALYFFGDFGNLLRYDILGGRELTVLHLPPGYNFLQGSPDYIYFTAIVMTVDNGGLGVATFVDGMLNLWSAETVHPYIANRWSHIKVINILKLLPIDIDMDSVWLSGFAEEANLIFLSTHDNGIFTIDLKSLLARKVCEMGDVKHVFPYVSFCNPAAYPRGALQSFVETQQLPS